MRILKVLLCLYFFLLFMIFVGVPLKDILAGTPIQYSPRSVTLLQAVLRDSAFLVVAIISGMASWICWRERNSDRMRGRSWPITASLFSLLTSIGPMVLYYHTEGPGTFWLVERLFAIPQAIGVIGLIVSWRTRAALSSSKQK
jgi:hypothetical protein